MSKAKLVVCNSKADVPQALQYEIIRACKTALDERGCFTIALSGGSLPSFLKGVSASFEKAGVDPMFDKWHVMLADERLVPSTDDDSNLKLIRENFLSPSVSIPNDQVYGIDEGLLADDDAHAAKVASAYEATLKSVLDRSDSAFDCVVLGFGPDGHTCSLFPGHELLQEKSKMVADIVDSPKPPPRRITLTFPVLDASRSVIVCGAGSSKRPIIEGCFIRPGPPASSSEFDEATTYCTAMLTHPPPYPCAMASPKSPTIWIVDSDAAEDLMAKDPDGATGTSGL